MATKTANPNSVANTAPATTAVFDTEGLLGGEWGKDGEYLVIVVLSEGVAYLCKLTGFHRKIHIPHQCQMLCSNRN